MSDAEEFRRNRYVAEEFRELLETDGFHAALAFLNRRTCHRFTGIYRFDQSMLRNLHLYDRTNPGLELGSDAPLHETYCSIVGTTASPFATDDAQLDERLLEHPARTGTLSYSGVPLQSSDGRAFGTLCHFDVVPCPADPEEVPILKAAAKAITERLSTM